MAGWFCGTATKRSVPAFAVFSNKVVSSQKMGKQNSSLRLCKMGLGDAVTAHMATVVIAGK